MKKGYSEPFKSLHLEAVDGALLGLYVGSDGEAVLKAPFVT